MSVQSEIQALINKLSSDLESLVRKAAVEAVQNVLGGSGPARASTGKRKPGPKPKASGTPEAARAPAAKPAKKGKRVRRTAAEIAATANRIHAYVKANPNANAERIKKALSIPNNQWGGPLGLLMSAKRLASKGEKRATTYTAR